MRAVKPRPEHQLAQTLETDGESRNRDVDQLSNVDYVPTHGESQLYIFEDSEAVIKMIIGGRSPTMRHVSRTHRVALDWLFDRINLEPKIQIKYVGTNKQLADTLTKGSFTCDEWNHLLRWFSIVNVSMFSCSDFSNFLSDPIRKQSAMSKRGQEATSREGSPMAKPKANGFGDGEVETHESGVPQPVECEEESSARFVQSRQSGECRKRTRRCSQHQETDAEPKPRSNRIFSSEATGKHSKCRLLETGRQG